MRLFIAINVNSSTKSQLIKVRDELRSRSQGGNFSKPENMHLTLAFLGECDTSRADAAKAIMDIVTFAPFPIEIYRIGRFRRDRGDIWWAGVRENKSLSDLQRRLSSFLRDAGFELDSKKFNPHVTLGREVLTDALPWDITPFGEDVRSIELMKSERINGKLIYTAIHRNDVGLSCSRSHTLES